MRVLTALLLFAQSAIAQTAQSAPRTVVAEFEGIIADFATAPDGRFLYYVTDAGDLGRLDRTRNTRTIIDKGGYRTVTISPAGDRLALIRVGDQATGGQPAAAHVWTLSISPATGTPRGSAKRISMSTADAPRISPDGNRIAYITQVVPRKIVVASVEGGPERVLTQGGGPAAPLRWSPDGKWILAVHSSVPSAPSAVHVCCAERNTSASLEVSTCRQTASGVVHGTGIRTPE